MTYETDVRNGCDIRTSTPRDWLRSCAREWLAKVERLRIGALNRDSPRLGLLYCGRGSVLRQFLADLDALQDLGEIRFHLYQASINYRHQSRSACCQEEGSLLKAKSSEARRLFRATCLAETLWSGGAS